MKTFNQIVADIFSIDVAQVRDELSSKDIPDWDSMNYLLFIAEVEKNFKISLGMNEVMNAQTLGDIRRAVDNHGV